MKKGSKKGDAPVKKAVAPVKKATAKGGLSDELKAQRVLIEQGYSNAYQREQALLNFDFQHGVNS